MDPPDRVVRKFIVDWFVEHGSAPALAEIASGTGRSHADARSSLRRLEEGRQLKLLEGTDRLLMVFPFSAVSTPFRVTRADGRRYFANCAWDAIAFHPMLGEPIRVDAFCDSCGTEVRFRVEDGRGVPIDRPLPRVRLGLPAADWWRDIARTCANTMVFLGSEEPAAREVEPDASRAGILTVDQVVALSVPFYATKLHAGHERPPLSVVRATFAQLGLDGPHWTL